MLPNNVIAGLGVPQSSTQYLSCFGLAAWGTRAAAITGAYLARISTGVTQAIGRTIHREAINASEFVVPSKVKRVAGQIVKTALPIAAVSIAGYLAVQAYEAYHEGRQLAELEGGYLEANRRRDERTTRISDRRVRRAYAQWMRLQGFNGPEEHPFAYRLFAEMGDHPLNRDYYAIAHRRLRNWFEELPKITDLVRPIAQQRMGRARPETVEDVEGEDDLEANEELADNPQGDNLLDLEERQMRAVDRLVVEQEHWDEQFRTHVGILLQQYTEEPREFTARHLDAGVIIRPEPALVYRSSCAIIEAALSMRANDLSISQYYLGREEIVAASREGHDLRPRGGLVPWAAGLISWRQAIWPEVPLPAPE